MTKGIPTVVLGTGAHLRVEDMLKGVQIIRELFRAASVVESSLP
jgi:hypothetical protein